MTNISGTELKRAIRLSGLPLAEISKQTGISQRSIFYYYDKETVSDDVIDKFIKANIPLKGAYSESETLLREVIETQRGSIAALEITVKQLRTENERLINQNSLLSSVITNSSLVKKKG